MGELFKKALSETVLTLLLLGILAFNIKPVRADEIIYIRPDGAVDPSTAPIQRVGEVYTFTDDIFNMSIEVQRDNIKLDGNGHMLQSSGEFQNFFAIYLYFGRGITITNIVVSDGFIYGILLDYSYNNKLVNNTLLGDLDIAIKLQNSDQNSLSYNKVVNACDAIWLESSSYNTLTCNELRENTWGISLDTCIGNTLRRNVMEGNTHNFFVRGYLYLDYWLHNVDTFNTVDGKPIYYWINRYNETVPLDAGCVVIVNSSRITVKNIKFRNNSASVSFAFTTNSLIENITATGDSAGIFFHRSDHNIITKNNFTANPGAGIVLEESYYNNITYNAVLHSNTSGIWLEDTGFNTLIGNTVAYCRHVDHPQEFDGSGILVDDSPWCKLINNTVMGNKYGIHLGATPSQYNVVVGNNIVMNDVGLALLDARYNEIFHNNFLQNKLQQVQTFYRTSGVTFDDGYPSGGNYWSDYAGVDLYSGPYQNETGSDGFGDTPYVINKKKDHYPLIQPRHGSVWNLNTGQNYPTIQRAINNADEKDRILALSRTYYENVVVNKSITLIGEDRDATIIDGNGTGSVVIINQNNVSITCFTIQKSGTDVQNGGVYLNNTEYCNITENIVTSNYYGIYLSESSNNSISGNNVANNSAGITLEKSLRNSIVANNMTGNNWHGVRLCCSSSNNSILENNITNNYVGIELEESFCNSIYGNRMANDWTGIQLDNSSNNWLVGNNITGSEGYGILVEFSLGNSVIENYIAYNVEVGVWLNNSNGNILISNTITGTWNGILLGNSSSNLVSSNIITNSESEGIFIDRSANNTLDNNIIAENMFGVWLTWFSEYNTISNNTIMNNQWGGIGLHGAKRNIISCNNVSGNQYGIDARTSSNNVIFHNNFINNTSQVYLEDSFDNTWDNTCEGNYWSNYNGTDLDADGIGDTYLPWESVDHYPLMNVYWNPADVDHDLDVDLYDAVGLLTAYGSKLGNEEFNCHCDIAEPYGVINLYDAVLLLVNYGEKYS